MVLIDRAYNKKRHEDRIAAGIDDDEHVDEEGSGLYLLSCATEIISFIGSLLL
jgi:hypothetical protein